MRKQKLRLNTEEQQVSPGQAKPIRAEKKAAAQAVEAQAKIPKKAVKTKNADPATGKTTTKLSFTDKKPPSKLSHTVTAVPLNTVSTAAHREFSRYEDDNVGLEAADYAESGAEAGTRFMGSAIRSQRLRTYRRAEAAESRLEQPASNPLSRLQQRRAIRKQYAAAKTGGSTETAKDASEIAAKAAEKAGEAAKKAAEFVRRHKKGFLIAGAIALTLAFLLNVFSSCSVILESMGSAVSASTYPSSNEDMLAAEEAYCGMEEALAEYLDPENYESEQEYDEYIYDLDDFEHDPYVLISLITAWHGGEWTMEEAGETLQMLFEKQYILTEEATTETRYRTVTRTGTRKVTDPVTGKEIEEEYEYEEEEEYEWSICSVSLVNFNLSHVPVYILSESRLSMYAIYMATLGNRPDLFPDSPYVARYSGGYTDYDIPPELLEDERFAAIITEAEKYLGFPYVWGGSSPSTSFDCSGFVSWVLNHSGWDVGRLGADGLYNICTPVSAEEARPGDLVFFQGTYDTTGMSHVGIYVGDQTMIHCGDPISYTNLKSSYWQEHLAAFGRLP